MSWKHEEPLEEEAANGVAPQANPVENGSHEAEGAPFRNLFGHPITSLAESGIPPVESNPRQVSGVMNTSEQDPSTNIDTTGLENGDTERSTPPPNSPRSRTSDAFRGSRGCTHRKER